MSNREIYSEPSRVSAVDGVVQVDGPDAVDIAMTPEAAEETSERLADESKNWKFRAGDLDDRKHWDLFTKAYRGILENTSTDRAPWYIVPADDKDLRDVLIARTVADALDSLDLRYPKPDPSLDEQLEVMLEQYEDMLELYGTHTGVNLARKHFGWYTKGLPGSAEVRNQVNQESDPTVVKRMLRDFYAPWLARSAA